MIKKLVFFLILLSTALIVSYAFFYLKNSTTQNINSLALRNGDLILRCGKSTESYAVHLADKNAEFTHIGIVSLENKTPYVIHIVPDKSNLVKKELLKEFLSSKNASQFAVYRSNYNSFFLKKVVQEANSFYLKKYTFDNNYDLRTDSKLYCTELVLKAFRNVGISLNVKPKELNYVVWRYNIIFPSEFTKLPVFNRIL